jgi:hypothetical protein
MFHGYLGSRLGWVKVCHTYYEDENANKYCMVRGVLFVTSLTLKCEL